MSCSTQIYHDQYPQIGDALGHVACEAFLGYLAGLPTTILANLYDIPVSRVNRMIKRTALRLLDLTGTSYERRMPPHLSRLRNESTLWIFRLAMVIPEDVVISLRAEMGEVKEEGAGALYVRLHALLMSQRQSWEGRELHSPCLSQTRLSCDPGSRAGRAR